MNLIDRYEKLATKLQVDYQTAQTNVRSERDHLRNATNRLGAAEEACIVVQEVSHAIQVHVHQAIAAVVSRCIAAVFENDYVFHIEFKRQRGKTEAVLSFHKNDLVLDDPLNQSGGGLVDIGAFALRLSSLLLSRPARRRVLVLDEPFSRVRGLKYRMRIATLLEQLAEELDVQFIINIDLDAYPEFELGHVIRL